MLTWSLRQAGGGAERLRLLGKHSGSKGCPGVCFPNAIRLSSFEGFGGASWFSVARPCQWWPDPSGCVAFTEFSSTHAAPRLEKVAAPRPIPSHLLFRRRKCLFPARCWLPSRHPAIFPATPRPRSAHTSSRVNDRVCMKSCGGAFDVINSPRRKMQRGAYCVMLFGCSPPLKKSSK